jgi:hypothetical protein
LRAVGERLRWLSKTSKAGTVCGAAKTGQLPFIDQFRPAHKPGGFKLRMAQESTFQAFPRLSQEIGEKPGRACPRLSRTWCGVG